MWRMFTGWAPRHDEAAEPISLALPANVALRGHVEVVRDVHAIVFPQVPNHREAKCLQQVAAIEVVQVQPRQ